MRRLAILTVVLGLLLLAGLSAAQPRFRALAASAGAEQAPPLATRPVTEPDLRAAERQRLDALEARVRGLEARKPDEGAELRRVEALETRVRELDGQIRLLTRQVGGPERNLFTQSAKGLETRLDAAERRVDQLENRQRGLERGLQRLEHRLDRVEHRR